MYNLVLLCKLPATLVINVNELVLNKNVAIHLQKHLKLKSKNFCSELRNTLNLTKKIQNAFYPFSI